MKFDGVLIASDLDGTLLGSDRKISERNLKAIEYFQKNGGTFTVATGRPPLALKGVLDQLKLQIPLILLNGSMIYDYNIKKLMKSYLLSSEIKELIEYILKNFPDVGVELFTEDNLHLLNYSYASKVHFDKFNRDVVVKNIDVLPEYDSWFKLNLTTYDYNLLHEIESYVKSTFGEKFHSCYSCKHFFEITNPSARKDVGVLHLAKEYGFDSEHIYTIGDNFNDLEMIKVAKLGFAPENAEDDVKANADVILPDHDRGSVAYMINHLDKIY